MLTISTSQLERVERKRFIDKADAALAARIPEWAASPPADRRHFIELCLERGARYGLLSEQSVMAYALGAVWLGMGFEEESPLLMQLLRAPMPEIRKSHGLSDWVGDQIGPHTTPESGDAAIRRSFMLTTPWGRF